MKPPRGDEARWSSPPGVHGMAGSPRLQTAAKSDAKNKDQDTPESFIKILEKKKDVDVKFLTSVKVLLTSGEMSYVSHRVARTFRSRHVGPCITVPPHPPDSSGVRPPARQVAEQFPPTRRPSVPSRDAVGAGKARAQVRGLSFPSVPARSAH